ncbi:MAG: hydrogenobyrinic acid a,c-diamide synthase (glutamine-hydrolyzing) [Arenicellales bacterium]|nr:hydrogenobyrinic acid a,c-diamide synthase (glutamine-hydrolyzing) [Arenicellales bacterium]
MASLLISATRKSSGKTSIGIGLAALLHSRGDEVQTFKKGPDYIDSMWLSRASQRPCINLDFYTMARNEIERVYNLYRTGAGVVIVEGNKGLFDGMDVKGSDCNAALSKLLDLPIILLVDANGITRGIAPLLHGYTTFDKDIRIAGIVLNKVAGDRHERKLRDAIAHYTDIEVLGVIHRSKEMEIEERHIGLVPSNEDQIAQRRVQRIADVLSQSVDVDKILALTTDRVPIPARRSASSEVVKSSISIGVAQDEAFGFYYPDDLAKMTQLGVQIEYFDTIRDGALPPVDALFIGGGFPEFYLDELEKNTRLKADIRRFIDDGNPVYAECGGLMYLCRDITFRGKTGSMVGAIQANANMKTKPVGRGYVQLQETSKHPWPEAGGDPPEELPVHEFHYSHLENVGDGVEFAYKVTRGVGIKDGFDGLVYKNILATYTHHRNVGCNHWVERFVKHITKEKNQREIKRNVAV